MSSPSIVHIEELLPGSICRVHLNGIGGVVEGESVEFLEVLDPPAANHVQRSHAVLVLGKFWEKELYLLVCLVFFLSETNSDILSFIGLAPGDGQFNVQAKVSYYFKA